jgi:hypothetical protein
MNSDKRIAGRAQQVAAATGLLGFGLWVAYVSFRVEDPQPYLFPQLISVALIGLAGVTLVRALNGMERAGSGFTFGKSIALAPAIALMGLYIFVLAPMLGYYIAAAAAFFTLYTLYDPQPHSEPRTWVTRLAITAGFISIIYVVFNLGLQVQTPRGLFF